eukprot:Rhum_TRINITY_DN13969_c2_g2::Rhum_TRINITY_DN13969_c2_g2_i1::g.66831::m.66831
MQSVAGVSREDAACLLLRRRGGGCGHAAFALAAQGAVAVVVPARSAAALPALLPLLQAACGGSGNVAQVEQVAFARTVALTSSLEVTATPPSDLGGPLHPAVLARVHAAVWQAGGGAEDPLLRDVPWRLFWERYLPCGAVLSVLPCDVAHTLVRAAASRAWRYFAAAAGSTVSLACCFVEEEAEAAVRAMSAAVAARLLRCVGGGLKRECVLRLVANGAAAAWTAEAAELGWDGGGGGPSPAAREAVLQSAAVVKAEAHAQGSDSPCSACLS